MSVGSLKSSSRDAAVAEVHRLDVEVGGLLVFAKEADAHRSLCVGFEAHNVRKDMSGVDERRSAGGCGAGQVVALAVAAFARQKAGVSASGGKEAVTLCSRCGATAII